LSFGSAVLMLLWFWPFVPMYEYGDSLGSWLHYLILFVLTILAVFAPLLAAYLLYRVRHPGFLRGGAMGVSSHPDIRSKE
jgi:hypothetical protein